MNYETLTRQELIDLHTQRDNEDKIIVDSLKNLFERLNLKFDETGKLELGGLTTKIGSIILKANLPGNSLEKEFDFLKPLLQIVDNKIKQSGK